MYRTEVLYKNITDDFSLLFFSFLIKMESAQQFFLKLLVTSSSWKITWHQCQCVPFLLYSCIYSNSSKVFFLIPILMSLMHFQINWEAVGLGLYFASTGPFWPIMKTGNKTVCAAVPIVWRDGVAVSQTACLLRTPTFSCKDRTAQMRSQGICSRNF